MALFARPTDMSHVSEVLEVAYTILQRTQDDDLAQKIANLSAYAALRNIFPDEDYEMKIRESLAELKDAVHGYCENQTETPSKRKVDWNRVLLALGVIALALPFVFGTFLPVQ